MPAVLTGGLYLSLKRFAGERLCIACMLQRHAASSEEQTTADGLYVKGAPR